jgi:exonuclease III
MKIITWNCNGAFRKKFEQILKFNADLYIIQECEDPKHSKDKNYIKFSENSIWIGDNKNKGLGIFAQSNILLTNNNWESNNLKYFISCKINNDFDILCVWCHYANSPNFRYIGQFWKYLQINKSKMKNIIIMGDFNSNKIWDEWDRWWNHSDVVRELSEIGIFSFYHKINNIEQGEEKVSTFFLYKNIEKKYHIDYVFGNINHYNKIKQLKYENFEEWKDKSDHIPILLEL